MSQSLADDFPIDPLTTSGDELADILNRFQAAVMSSNSGAAAPPDLYPGTIWIDTSGAAPVMKIRNADNSGWDTIPTSGSTAPYLLPDGTVAAPSLAFKSEPQLGLYRVGAGSMAFANTGVRTHYFPTGGTATALQMNPRAAGTSELDLYHDPAGTANTDYFAIQKSAAQTLFTSVAVGTGAKKLFKFDAASFTFAGGPVTAPQFNLNANCYWSIDANNVYWTVKQNSYLYASLANGSLTYNNLGTGGSGKATIIHATNGDFISPAGIYAGGQQPGLGLEVAGNARRLRFTTDGWRLDWDGASGNLNYVNPSGVGLLTISGSNGTVNTPAGYTSSGGAGVGYLCYNYQDAGGGTLVRYMIQANPGWAEVYIMGIHVQGNWAGMRMQASSGSYIDFVLSGSAGSIGTVRANIEGSVSYASNAGALVGRGGADYIHDNGTGNPEYIRNSGVSNLICYINGAGEYNWPIGPSDARLKENIADTAQDSLSMVRALRFVGFNYKAFAPLVTTPDQPEDADPPPPVRIDDGHFHPLGLVAQEADQVNSEIVSKGGTYLQLDPIQMSLLALHAVQQLAAKVDALH